MELDGQKRSGSFNWIGLLVLVLVLAIMAFCLVPAMDNSRGPSRRGVCANNMRSLAAALLYYENSQREFPGYRNVLTTRDQKVYIDTATGRKTGLSWVIMILRQLDQPDLDDIWKAPASESTPTKEAAKRTTLGILICPSDPPAKIDGTPLSYVVNCGIKDWAGSATMPRDWGGNGVFFDRFTGDARIVKDKADGIPIVTMSRGYIARHDGLQNTILLTENVDAGNYNDIYETRVGILWSPKGTIDKTTNPPHLVPWDENMRINAGIGKAEGAANPTPFARPSSYHPGGVNVAFCDGRVIFLSEKIDYYVYCLLMSTNGQRVREPGSNKVIPNFAVEIVKDAWLQQ